jgi:hypothetical protein
MFGRATARTTFGVIGVKCWIYKDNFVIAPRGGAQAVEELAPQPAAAPAEAAEPVAPAAAEPQAAAAVVDATPVDPGSAAVAEAVVADRGAPSDEGQAGVKTGEPAKAPRKRAVKKAEPGATAEPAAAPEGEGDASS